MNRNRAKATPEPVNRSGQDLLKCPELLSNGGLEIERVLDLGNCSTHVLPVLSGSGEKKPTIIDRTIKTHQPALRLVVNRDALFEVPRKYDQSTSGRTDSTGTAPELSRSRAMAVDSAIRSFVDKALRRYPSVVPARSAYDSCSGTDRELRYVRSASDIWETLPDSKVIPLVVGNSFSARRTDNRLMSLADTRRARLRALIAELGSQKALADLCGFQSDNYVSQLLNPQKSFGEKTARNIEKASGKPAKWLDSFDETPALQPAWPFQIVDKALWDRLHPLKKRELENTFQQLIIGASVQEAAAPSRKRKA